MTNTFDFWPSSNASLTAGEAVLEVSFRSPVPIEHAESIVEAAGEYTTVYVHTMSFGYPDA
ncbi:MAG: hypothetical protein AVDCRST_MAG05-2049 [uncultured Rubrobacteraceae bacterium]|uniref:Uncharacterized protein n=1 Tax=uncultured Rubrobacteraceae bacterium TaxID=349277 RepID=A0A6J4SEW3_9ACTN|nr:MAG: hypothetical protein AVDCRST_MAG05-2049 [uncultured Rubrobacteraceae bacterium]